MLEAGDSSSGLVKCEKRATMCLCSLVQCVTAGDGGAFGFTGRACPDQGEFAKCQGLEVGRVLLAEAFEGTSLWVMVWSGFGTPVVVAHYDSDRRCAYIFSAGTTMNPSLICSILGTIL